MRFGLKFGITFLRGGQFHLALHVRPVTVSNLRYVLKLKSADEISKSKSADEISKSFTVYHNTSYILSQWQLNF